MKKLWIIISISLSIIIVIIAGVFIMFPKKYTSLIVVYSDKYSLSRAMVASVINIESGYNSSSVSDAGAKGLMQLLPVTAFDCANRLNIEITDEDLFNPEKNIEIGCFYLSYLLDMFEGNIVNTLCAYNWGLGNVKNWISLGNVDSNGTINNIPVEETKNYIKKYKVSYFVYKNLYKF